MGTGAGIVLLPMVPADRALVAGNRANLLKPVPGSSSGAASVAAFSLELVTDVEVEGAAAVAQAHTQVGML